MSSGSWPWSSSSRSSASSRRLSRFLRRPFCERRVRFLPTDLSTRINIEESPMSEANGSTRLSAEHDVLRFSLPRSSSEIWKNEKSRSLMSGRSDEHTSELQSLMRISYAVFCLKKKKTTLKSRYLY